MARDVTKGDIPVLILSVLAEISCHGYAIARRIEQQSANALSMKEGTLYPALRVLEQDEMIAGAWEVQPSGPARKVYRITAKGQAELTKRRQEWEQYVTMMNVIMGRTRDAQSA
jgi:PadR family transcriptional regulator PadR